MYCFRFWKINYNLCCAYTMPFVSQGEGGVTPCTSGQLAQASQACFRTVGGTRREPDPWRTHKLHSERLPAGIKPPTSVLLVSSTNYCTTVAPWSQQLDLNMEGPPGKQQHCVGSCACVTTILSQSAWHTRNPQIFPMTIWSPSLKRLHMIYTKVTM